MVQLGLQGLRVGDRGQARPAFAHPRHGLLRRRQLGQVRDRLPDLGAGVAGSLGSLLLGSGLPSIGASGAVCGFIGAMASWGKKRGGLQGAVIRRVMIQWAVFILILGLLMRGIDNWAHAGGFFGGMGLGLIITPKGFTLESGLRRRFWSAAAAGVVAVFVLCGATAAANVVRARHVEKIRPDIAKVDIAVEQAIRAYENSLDERMPAPTARAGLLSTADRLRDSTPRLGGDATRVVDMIEKALRARADDLKDLVGPDKPSGGASLAAMKKAVALWRDHLLAIGYR